MTTESDRELLELAAKAAGIPIIPCTCRHERWPFKHDEARSGKSGHWNPLEDDGDALRLAVTLLIDVDQGEIGTTNGKPAAIAHYRFTLKSGQVAWNSRSELHETDPYAATRRAIVRAAAAIATHKEQT